MADTNQSSTKPPGVIDPILKTNKPKTATPKKRVAAKAQTQTEGEK